MMRRSCSRLIPVFCFLFGLVLVKSQAPSSANEFEVPPLNVSQEAILNHMNLGGNIRFDVPALFVFGDSVLDSGNNNNLLTNSKANYYPFGVDFGGKPTGRFSNGRNEADFIAQVLGLPFPPPYLGLSDTERKTTMTGVNYASSSCGILPKTGDHFGKCLPLEQQINLFERTIENLGPQFSNETSRLEYLSKSLFLINAGAADTGYGYDGFESKMNESYTFPAFAEFLNHEFSTEITRLYELGARKFLVNNIFANGCIPFILNTAKPKTMCDESTNNRTRLFNTHLYKMLPDLESRLPGSKLLHADVYEVMLDAVMSPNLYGITDTRNSCCIDLAGNGTLPCMKDREPCSNRHQHLFFDPFHPSEKTQFLFAVRSLKDSSISTPITLMELLQA